MNNLYQIIENSKTKYPENVALGFGEQRISYKKVKEASDRLAGGLKNMGLGPGDRIALMLPNVPQFVMSYFSLLKIGVTIVPISIFFKAEEIRYQVEDAEVRGIIFWDGFRQNVKQAVYGLGRCEKLIVLGEKAESGEVRLPYLMEINDPLEETVEVEPDDTAVIAYSAGTTGQYKGVELTHRNILSEIDACCTFLGLVHEDGVVGVLPLYHPLGHVLVMGCFLRCGGNVILVPKFHPENILKMIEKEKPTYFVGVPTMYRGLLKVEDGDKMDIGTLKFCLSSGDALKQETMKTFKEKFKVPILEGYGLTEASSMVSFNSPVRERKPGSIGLPLPGIDMKIVDESGSEVRTGQVGEIIVKGPIVMKGYLNQPEATEEALKDGWLHTGDLAQLNEDGFGFIVVREENVIIKSGFNIYPKEVEKLLSGYSKIKEVVVVGVDDPAQGEEIHASIVLKEGEAATPEEIIEYSKAQMETYKCPSVIHFVSSHPKGPTGRVLRDKVKEFLVDNKGGVT